MTNRYNTTKRTYLATKLRSNLASCLRSCVHPKRACPTRPRGGLISLLAISLRSKFFACRTGHTNGVLMPYPSDICHSISILSSNTGGYPTGPPDVSHDYCPCYCFEEVVDGGLSGVDREFGRLPTRGGLPNEGSKYIPEVRNYSVLYLCVDLNFQRGILTNRYHQKDLSSYQVT